MNYTVAGRNVSLGDGSAVYHNAAARAGDIERAALSRCHSRGSHRRNIGAADATTRNQVILQYLRELRRVLQKSIQLILGQLRESGVSRREQRKWSSATQVIVQTGCGDRRRQMGEASVGADYIRNGL